MRGHWSFCVISIPWPRFRFVLNKRLFDNRPNRNNSHTHEILNNGCTCQHGKVFNKLNIKQSTKISIPWYFSHSAHAVIRKWILLSDPEDKMAGAKVLVLNIMSCFNVISVADETWVWHLLWGRKQLNRRNVQWSVLSYITTCCFTGVFEGDCYGSWSRRRGSGELKQQF